MIIHDAPQGSPEWLQARLGIPTASNFDRIITKAGKPSASAEKYMHQLLAEWFLQTPIESDSSQFMKRGTEMEIEAGAWYAWTYGIELQKVGFCTTDNGLIGCSPDRLVREDGLLEIKCPSAVQHVANALSMTEDYTQQVQGQLYVTGRQWVDLLSYHPTMSPVCVRIERDEEYIDALDNALAGFLERLEASNKRLLAMGWAAPPLAEV